MTDAQSVARYYDRNTRRFLAFGGGGDAAAIHRHLWGPGIATARAAAGYVNELLGDAIAARHPDGRVVVLDLGCGVGGTLQSLGRRFPAAALHGVTISPEQAALGNDLAAAEGLAERCRITLADFESLDIDVAADVALAVEAFTHSGRAERFFAAAARHLSHGATLIVVDDFLRIAEIDLPRAGRRIVERFRAGWRVPGVCTVARCVGEAGRHGFRATHERDLTDLIRLSRARDRAIALVSPAVRVLGLAGAPFFGNLVGGNALRRGTLDGIFAYRWLEFRKER